MRTKFEVIKRTDDLIYLSIYNLDIPEQANILVNQCFTKELYDKAGNIIDKSIIPYQVCHTLLKAYQSKMHNELLRISYFIFDDDLRNNVINYARELNEGKIGLTTEKEFYKFIDDFKECIKDW